MVRDLLTFRPSSKNWEKLRLILWVNEISESRNKRVLQGNLIISENCYKKIKHIIVLQKP